MAVQLKDTWSLPSEFLTTSDATMVCGDLDAFFLYFETGQAFEDWQVCCRAAARQREAFFTSNKHLWHHIVHIRSTSNF